MKLGIWDLNKTREFLLFILFVIFRAIQVGSIIWLAINSFQALADQPFLLIFSLFMLLAVIIEWMFYWVMTLIW
jgi:hypothetical protein